MNKEIPITEALNGKRTFYAKRWQSNGYYPISKFVYHPNRDAFEQFVKKNSGWLSWGITETRDITNKDWWGNIFEHNPCKLSFGEMTDNKHYNCE